MIAVTLKSLIYYDSLKLTKNVCCSIFRSSLIVKQTDSISHRYFNTKFPGNGDRRLIVLPHKTHSITDRQFVTKIPKKKIIGPIRWKSVLIVTIIGSGVLVLFKYMKEKKLKLIEAQRNREIGKAKLGGSFDLVDQDNKPVTSDDLLGNWLLIYFGFTHCPDICPDEIEKMIEVVDKIDNNKNMSKVKPVFITVDPERDTPGIIKKYLKEFSDKIIGLTGTVEQIGAVCKAYRVYFSPGPKDSDADYIVDHSIIMYLVDPQGKFIDFYGQNKNADDIVSSIHFNQLKSTIQKSNIQKVKDLFSTQKSE